MKSPNDRKYRLRPTKLCGTRGTCNTTQDKFGQAAEVCGCLVTLPKPSHILLPRLVAMRPFLTLVAMVVSCSAQAQFPYSYGPYYSTLSAIWRAVCPTCPGSITSVDSPGNTGRAQRDPRQGGCPAAGLVGSTRPSGARLGRPSDRHGCFAHRPNNQYGENAYTISGSTTSPAQVVGYWAGEARGYDVRSNTCSGVCGHYTQIVWGTTRAVGCAVATDRRREVWACNYDPPGNIVGYRPY